MSERQIGMRRLLADVYSDDVQRANSSPWLLDDYVGQLRFDGLLAETVVLPDVHLLDGPFFLSVGPSRLADALGRGDVSSRGRQKPVAGIEVRSRAVEARPQERLAGSLRRLLFRADNGTLSGFSFEAIENDVIRAELRHRLRDTPAAALHRRLERAREPEAVPSTIVNYLRDLLGSSSADPDLERMEEGWRDWIQAERDGLIAVVLWDKPLSLDVVAQSTALDEGRHLATPAGRELYGRVRETMRLSNYQSDIIDVLESSSPSYLWRSSQFPADEAISDLATLYHWYLSVRYSSLARQHDADYAQSVSFLARPLSDAEEALARLHDEAVVPDVLLPDELFPGLSDLPDDQFAAFLNRHRMELQQIWHAGDLRASRHVFEDLSRELPSLSARTAGRKTRLTRIGVVVASVAGTAAGAALAGAGAIVSVASASLAGQAVNAVLDWLNAAPERRVVRRAMLYARRRG